LAAKIIHISDLFVDVEVPRKTSDQLRPIMAKSEELLRHFWNSERPVGKLNGDSKFERMGALIESYYTSTLSKQKKLEQAPDRKALAMMMSGITESLFRAVRVYKEFISETQKKNAI
jgi:hypothetical protein